jgi:hypothetical protein
MQAGDLLGGRYRLKTALGHGGMSVVWRAHDEVLGREVAVKVLAPNHIPGTQGTLDRLRGEARAAARLCHPHVVNVFDYGETPDGEGTPVSYVVMEMVDGVALSGVLSRGPMPWPAAARVCGQVAAALSAAHAHGIVHRDVTPANVMLTEGGAKLVDFGISASTGETEGAPGGLLLGTPAYLAPERLDGGPVRPATDVYALGLLLYKTLTGRLPWQRATTTQMLLAHRYVDPPPLPPVPGLPQPVAELCRRCLAKRPEDRPSSAEAAQLLDQVAVLWGYPAADAPTAPLAGGRPRTPTAVLTAPAGSAPPSRRRLRLALTAVGLLLLGTLGGSLSGSPTQARQAEPLVLAAGVGARAVECQVHYEVRADRGNGFTAGITVTNAGASLLDAWRLSFAFGGDQRVVRGTPGVWHQVGREVSVSGSRLAGGGAAVLALDGTYRTANQLPTAFELNGSTCASTLGVAARPSPPAAESGSGGGHQNPGKPQKRFKTPKSDEKR